MIRNNVSTHHSASLRGGLKAVPPDNTRFAQNRREPEGVLPGLREPVLTSLPNQVFLLAMSSEPTALLVENRREECA